MGYPNLSSLAVCGRASPASRNEELSDARHSNRSDPQAGKISPRTRRRRRLAPSARLLELRLHPRPHRTLGAGTGTAKRRVAPKPRGEFQRCFPRRPRQPRTLAETARDIGSRPTISWRWSPAMTMAKTTPEQNKATLLEAFDTLFNKRDYTAAER